MESLEATVPWQAVAGFLNSLFSYNTVFSRIQDEKFPIGEYETAPQLPEDFLIRGQVWSQFYYPNNFFKDTSGYGISIDEMDSEEVTSEKTQVPLARSANSKGQLTSLGT